MAKDEATGPLIERERELQALERVLVRGSSGRPSALLVIGEPGLGKSRLLQAVAGEGGTLVLRGYSLEADTPPYFPFRRALAAADRARTLPPANAAIPMLRAAGVLPGERPAAGEFPAIDSLAVADALTELFVELAARAPVVLVLDDMQWASAAAWEAIAYLTRAAQGSRLALVLAARPEALDPAHPGAAAVVELNRNRLLQVAQLQALSEAGTSRLASAVLGERPAPALVSAIVARTAGNPFFVEEVLQGLAESGHLAVTPDGVALAGQGRSIAVPPALRLAVWQRVVRLPSATVDALQAAAVVGRVFELSQLSEMAGERREAIAAAMVPAATARIVVQEGGDRWTFAHDTLREAILDQVGAGAPGLHRAAARALTEGAGPVASLEAAARIAYHLREAGDEAEAIAASLHASKLALAAHAADEALDLALAAEALYLDGRARPSHLAARDVHRAVAQAAALAADYARAEAAWQSVLDLTDDEAERARVLVELATVARKAERSDAAAEYFRRALAILSGGGDNRALIEALLELSTLEGTTRSDYAPALERAERALAMARDARDAGLEARAALALANARARSETPELARPLLSLALERALDANELATAAEAAASLSNAFYWTGELRTALVYGQRRLEIAQRGRDAFALRHAHTWLSLLATTVGDWQTASEMAARAEPAITRLGSPEPLGFLRVVEGLLALRTGEIDLALARTGQAMDLLTPLGEATVSWYAAIRIWALIAAGLRDEAARECELQEARLLTMPDNALPARSARCGLGRVYVALGDLAHATECEASLLPYADDFHWRPARLTLAAVAALRGDRDRATGLLREVEAFASRNGLDYDVADTRRILAALEGGAAAEVAFARPDARPAVAPAHADIPGGLSPRECEVLRLVARGLSNREIADRLVLSERTVVNHISHIFSKISVENRAAATAFAFRTGLAGDE